MLHTSRGPVLCRCADVGIGGMSVEVQGSARFRKRLRVEWTFQGELLELEAVVARRRRVGSGHRLGLKFLGGGQANPALAEVVRVLQVHSVLARQTRGLLEQLPRLHAPPPEGLGAPAVPRPFPAGEGPSSTPFPRPPPGGTVSVATVPHQVPAAAEASRLPRPSLGSDDDWRDDELETQQFRDSSPPLVSQRGPSPLVGLGRGHGGSAVRTGDTVVAAAPQAPARTGTTVVVRRAEVSPPTVVEPRRPRGKSG